MSETDPAAPVAQPEVAPPLVVQPLPKATFLDPAAAAAEVKLKHPVRLPDGRALESVCLRRITVAEIKVAYANAAARRQSDPEAGIDFELFRDVNGASISADDLDLLEADDFDAVDKAAADFLPRRLVRQSLDSNAG